MRMSRSDTSEAPRRRRVRGVLLVLLWVWAVVIFLIVDLFRSPEEFDRVRPDSRIYRGMQQAAHDLVGEEYRARLTEAEVEAEIKAAVARRGARGRSAVEIVDKDFGTSRLPPRMRMDDRLSYVEHGTYTQWNDPGKAKGAGEYKAGRRVGKWAWKWPNGQLREERHYEKGLLQGRVASWYPDGSKERIEFYAKGKRDGEWKAWYAAGGQASLENYKDGMPHGDFIRWYEDGTKAGERRFVDGRAEGALTLYHPNGNKKVEGVFENGKKNGVWTFFSDAGGRLREERYENGKRIGSGSNASGGGLLKVPERR
jgi:antitoxin component YwqK of YwqJK toxin-antitoxin module